MSFSELYSMSYHGLNLESPDSTDKTYHKEYESIILAKFISQLIPSHA